MLKSKKRGSTLITVISVFAILFTFSTAVLSLTLSGMKSRKLENSKLENLYAAESGIDSAKKVLEVAVDTSIKKANSDVLEETNEIKSQIENLKSATTSNYKNLIDTIVNTGTNYKIFLKNEIGPRDENNTLYYLNDEGSIDITKIKEKQKAIFSQSYKDTLSRYLDDCITYDSEKKKTIFKYMTLENDIIKFEKELVPNNSAVITLKDFTELPEERIHDINTKDIPITIQSTFTHDKLEKKLETKFSLEVPDLSNNNLSNNPLLQKTIAADGNMYITSNFQVNGDVFIKGERNTELNDETVVYTKYDGGINININENERKPGNDSGKKDIKVQFNGNVVTPGTLNIKQKSTVDVTKGNIYANNINLGKITSRDNFTSDNKLTVATELVVDNDFTFNAKTTKITLENLYAINEISTDKTDNTPEKSSSCIIINNSMKDGSTLTINKDAFIVGTAFINTETPYQTGEAIAIKGNYSAYTSPINDPDNPNREYLFNYYAPLQLVDKYKTKIKVKDPITGIEKEIETETEMKAEHKAPYFLKAANKNGLTNDGAGSIFINGKEENIYINGVYINNGEAKLTGKLGEKEEQVKEKRREYANQVYEMGNFKSTGTNDPLMDVYNDMTVNKTVSNLININKDIDKREDDNIAVVINNPNSKILLSNYNADSSEEGYDKVINISGKKGIIITNGDIEFDSVEAEFQGTIISTKDISTKQDESLGDITVKYNGAVVQSLINKYNLEDIFYTTDTMVSGFQSGTGTDINSSNYVKNKYWKIVK